MAKIGSEYDLLTFLLIIKERASNAQRSQSKVKYILTHMTSALKSYKFACINVLVPNEKVKRQGQDNE